MSERSSDLRPLYLNPFWQLDRAVVSPLGPEECRTRLKSAPTGDYLYLFRRSWLTIDDGTFFISGAGRSGSVLQMHVRVKVMPEGEQAAKLRLRFSGGIGSALLLLLIELGGLYAFVWSIWSVAAGAWTWFVAAALFGILVPVLLVLALRSTAAHDIRELTDWVAGLVDGTGPGSGVGDK